MKTLFKSNTFQHKILNAVAYKCMSFALLIGLSSQAFANEVSIVDVKISCQTTCRFSVTLKHDDTGWNHYANRWEVLDLKGNVLATRVLHHPHVDEQPFTRSLGNVQIPDGIKSVIIRAHDSEHKYSEKTVEVVLPK